MLACINVVMCIYRYVCVYVCVPVGISVGVLGLQCAFAVCVFCNCIYVRGCVCVCVCVCVRVCV